MAKKKTTTVSLESQSTVGEEVSLETNPPIETIYTKERYDILVKLQSVVAPTNSQIQQIYELYKIFINPDKAMPSTSGSCSSCGNSISKLYWDLMQWFKENKSKFN
jgi:hypothetical protein